VNVLTRRFLARTSYEIAREGDKEPRSGGTSAVVLNTTTVSPPPRSINPNGYSLGMCLAARPLQQGGCMTKRGLLAALLTIVVSPLMVAAQGNGTAYGRDKPKEEKPIKIEKVKDDKQQDKDVKDKSVPAPPVLVLLAAGAGVAGVAQWRRRKQQIAP
jgi:hypothetical protein